jgi:hypothetical protein
MRRPALLLAVLLAAALGLGCGRDTDAPRSDRATIPSATFTRVLQELSAARAQTLPDTAAFRQRRDEILERHGVTSESLLRFVEAHGADDERMAPIYLQVGARLDSLMQERVRSGAGADRFPTSLPEDEPVRYGPDGLQSRPGAASPEAAAPAADTTAPGADTTALAPEVTLPDAAPDTTAP